MKRTMNAAPQLIIGAIAAMVTGVTWRVAGDHWLWPGSRAIVAVAEALNGVEFARGVAPDGLPLSFAPLES